jgi:hypothetical protein
MMESAKPVRETTTDNPLESIALADSNGGAEDENPLQGGGGGVEGTAGEQASAQQQLGSSYPYGGGAASYVPQQQYQQVGGFYGAPLDPNPPSSHQYAAFQAQAPSGPGAFAFQAPPPERQQQQPQQHHHQQQQQQQFEQQQYRGPPQAPPSMYASVPGPMPSSQSYQPGYNGPLSQSVITEYTRQPHQESYGGAYGGYGGGGYGESSGLLRLFA